MPVAGSSPELGAYRQNHNTLVLGRALYNITEISVLRVIGLRFLDFDLQYIFGRNSQVKHLHEKSKSICVTTINLRILHSVVTVEPSQLSILWVMGMKQLAPYLS
jgi:hypothetical protein